MSQDNATATKTRTQAAATETTHPMFALWRAAFEEGERHADHWTQLGLQQLADNIKIAQTMRAQSLAAMRGFLEAGERMSGDLFGAFSAFTRSAGKVQA